MPSYLCLLIYVTLSISCLLLHLLSHLLCYARDRKGEIERVLRSKISNEGYANACLWI
jgi:hypothetical protein